MRPSSSFPMNSNALAQENARFMTRVYGWMSGGVLVTALVAGGLADNPDWMMTLITNRPIFYALIIAQLAAVFTLAGFMPKLSAAAATAIYLGYAALTGVTISSIFLVYTQDSIASTFVLTSFGFAGLSAFGLVTKRDLGPVGSFCSMALFGMIGWGLLSIFFPSLLAGQRQILYSAVGVVVFAGLTAYDTQKIKELNILGNEGTEEDRKEAIHGALTLYLDFINLFLMLLRLMGDRRRD